jgi:hypothetical protein
MPAESTVKRGSCIRYSDINFVFPARHCLMSTSTSGYRHDPAIGCTQSSGTFPVSTYLASHDLAIAKSLFSCPCAATIPSMDAAPPSFSVSAHALMTLRRREHDRCTSLTPMATEVSCSEVANSDKLGMSLFPLYARKKGTGEKREQKGRVLLCARVPVVVGEDIWTSRTKLGPCRIALSWLRLGRC